MAKELAINLVVLLLGLAVGFIIGTKVADSKLYRIEFGRPQHIR
jgi:hypothetical protein